MVSLFVSEAIPHACCVAAVAGGGWSDHVSLLDRKCFSGVGPGQLRV